MFRTNGNWRRTKAFPSGAGRSPPPTGDRSRMVRPGQRRTAERLRQRLQGMGGNCGREHPQSVQQPRAIPQSPSGRQLPLHKGAFGDGGCGLPRRFAPRNDSPDPLSFREGPTGRRGNPSFLRWTGGGPPRSSAPTKGLPKSQQRADVGIGPYGKERKPHQPPRPAAHSGASAARMGGMGGDRGRDHPKRGAASVTAEAALSEAESAERGAGQIRSLPDTLRVQHGVPCPEV